MAAALLKKQGYEVIGVHFQLYSGDRGNADEAAKALNVPLLVEDVRERFNKLVVEDFVNEYRNGRTPNPCVRCNPFIKFDRLRRRADELGIKHIATGHYARTGRNECGYFLKKGADPRKDQAYVLYRLDQGLLARTLFPLGDLTKTKVKRIAEELGLPAVSAEESQEICFIENDDYGRFLREICPESARPGPILDKRGNIIGMHGGIAFYTLGQRKGIGHHKGLPKYVIEIDREKNLIVIGDEEDTFGKELVADQFNYVSGKAPEKILEGTAKIRYNSPEASAVLHPLKKGGTRVVFEKPQRAITPGQSVVFYKGDEVIGGGIIG